MKLKNKTALVTGGSRGIGKAIGEEFLKEGARVIFAARSASELEEIKKEHKEAEIAVLDVTDEAAIKALAERTGAADILVNAAGIYGAIGGVTEADPKEWLTGITINLYGTFLPTRYFGSLMKEKKSGVIINFVGGGEGAYPNFSSYVASKGGIARFTETVAKELEPFHVRVNAISPGPVNTKFVDDILAAGPEKAGEKAYKKAQEQKESGGTSPEKAAKLAVFLASDESAGITGRIISAEWTPYEKLPEHIEELKASDVYQMRKIVPKDRGFDWEDKK